MKLTVYLLVCPIALSLASVSLGDTITRFEAVMTNAGVISDGVIGSTSTASGIARLTLTQPDGDPAGTTLEYAIELEGLDLDGFQTPGVTADDVTAIHFHDVRHWPDGSTNEGIDTAGTLHVLNVFGVPRGGDDKDDMMFDPAARLVEGIWQDTDATPEIPMAPSVPVSEQVDNLFAGNLYVMLHTTEFSGGALGGMIRVVPEPSTWVLLAFGATLCVVARRGR